MFAATPPLESMKLLLSLALTEGIGWDGQSLQRMKLDFIDVRKAYLQARVNIYVYVKLPVEDHEEGVVAN